MIPTAALAAISIKMRRIKEAFRTAGALSATTAIQPADHHIQQGVIFSRLVRQGILVPVAANRFYLNEQRDHELGQRKRKLLPVVLLLLALLLLVSGIAAWLH